MKKKKKKSILFTFLFVSRALTKLCRMDYDGIFSIYRAELRIELLYTVYHYRLELREVGWYEEKSFPQFGKVRANVCTKFEIARSYGPPGEKISNIVQFLELETRQLPLSSSFIHAA